MESSVWQNDGVQLYLLRHGIAEDNGPDGTDESRRLTSDGRTKLKRVLEVAREAGVKPSMILTSPLVRARQTAEIAAGVLGYNGGLVESDALIPSADPAEIWEEIRVHKNEESVLLASHEPLMSQMTGFLLGTPSLLVDMKKGAIVRIDFDRFGASPRGVLKWMLTPKLAGV